MHAFFSYLIQALSFSLHSLLVSAFHSHQSKKFKVPAALLQLHAAPAKTMQRLYKILKVKHYLSTGSVPISSDFNDIFIHQEHCGNSPC